MAGLSQTPRGRQEETVKAEGITRGGRAAHAEEGDAVRIKGHGASAHRRYLVSSVCPQLRRPEKTQSCSFFDSHSLFISQKPAIRIRRQTITASRLTKTR